VTLSNFVQKPRIAILYGFSEGKYMSRQLRKDLAAAGFDVVARPENADIILAHSGGLFLVPDTLDLRDKTLVLDAPAIGYQGKSLLRPGLQKIWMDVKHSARTLRGLRTWLVKSLFNAGYLVSAQRDSRQMLRGCRQYGATLPLFKARRIVIISHHNDPWSGYIKDAEITKHDSYSFMSHHGPHDDLWSNPQEYISVIQYGYES
jgi:hypothetical protein